MLEFVLKPWHLIVLYLASHLNREQERIIEYLQVKNEVSGGRIRTYDLWVMSPLDPNRNQENGCFYFAPPNIQVPKTQCNSDNSVANSLALMTSIPGVMG